MSASDSEDSTTAKDDVTTPVDSSDLKARIDAFEFDYDAHVHWLTFLRRKAKFHELSVARERMSRIFALPAGIHLLYAHEYYALFIICYIMFYLLHVMFYLLYVILCSI